jgi:5-methylcytosine-specific restriction enzyme subunit McrC
LGQDYTEFIAGHTIRPDIVVKKDGKVECIIDTKWKLPKDKKASVADLRQMYAYARYWNVKKVILLYPGDKDKSMEFSEYITDDYSKSIKEGSPEEINHLCRVGFVSVLDQQVLSERVGHDVYELMKLS